MNLQKELKLPVLIQLILPLILLIFGIYHGLLQTMYRAGVIKADRVLGIEYYQGLTAHGVINAIVLTTFFAVGFGNIIISQMLKERICSRLTWASLTLMIVGTLSAALEIFAGRATVLYTFYPPLKASPLFYLGLALFIVGSWVSLWSWIRPYLRWRKANPQMNTPLSVVGIFATFIVWQLCTLPVAYEVLVLLLPWSMGWVSGVNVTLARTLFWFFGHPLVYFWLLPTYVMFYTVLPQLAGGKLFSDFGGRLAFMLFIVLSSPLGLHHQFADPGISTNWKGLHAVLTSLVAVPSLITAFTVAASLELASRMNGGNGLFAWWLKLPYFNPKRWLFPYLFCGLVIFIFGGVTGIVNASFNVNNVVHNTAWIPAHFHLTVGGPVFLGILGMSLFAILGLMGRRMPCPKLAISVPYLWMIGVFTMSTGQFIGSFIGEPRRSNLGMSYLNPDSIAYRPDWLTTTHVSMVGGILMTLSILIFFVVLIRGLLSPRDLELETSFEIPQSECFHADRVGYLKNFRPWVIAAVAATIFAYGPPLYDIYKANYPLVPGFESHSPLPVIKEELSK